MCGIKITHLAIFLAELLMRIELTTSSLPRKCSTTELQQHSLFKILNFKILTLYQSSKFEFGILNFEFILSGRRGSNRPPIAWKAIALPTELLPHSNLEFKTPNSKLFGGENRIRTCEDISQQIYSLSSLAA